MTSAHKSSSNLEGTGKALDKLLGVGFDRDQFATWLPMSLRREEGGLALVSISSLFFLHDYCSIYNEPCSSSCRVRQGASMVFFYASSALTHHRSPFGQWKAASG